jgi:hypothetical protein
MNREVAFWTNLFESKMVQPHFINDRCFGEDLAEWLIDKLRAGEFSLGESSQEDWGWEIEAEKDGEVFLVQLGIMDESIGEENAEWLISIEKPKSWFSFKKPDSSNFERLCRKIEEVLRAEPAITEISWTK